MNDSTRDKVIAIANKAGFLVQTKTDGLDLYKKNMVFKHGGVGQTVYVRKERGMDTLGNAKKYTLAIHPDCFRQEFSNPSRGYFRLSNSRNGGYVFSSSNYQQFPHCPKSQQHCGNHIEAANEIALGELFMLLGGVRLPETKETSLLGEEQRLFAQDVEEMPRFNEPLDVSVRVARAVGELSGLVIRREPLQRILRGEKTWEMRSKQVHKRGPIALIEKGSGLVVGVANLVDCKGPLNDEEMLANQDKHRIEPERLHAGEVAKWRTAWLLEGVQPLPNPIPYQHPSGAVTWVSLAADVVEQVRTQVDI